MPEYSQGVCEDGVAILMDGKPLNIEEILAQLRAKSFSNNGEVNIEKASSPELRKSITIATVLAKTGILFVAMPVLNKEDGNNLRNESFRRINLIEISAIKNQNQ